MLKIEKGIQIPKFVSGKKEYPFDDLKVGESFFRECFDKNEAIVIGGSIRAIASRRKKEGKEFAVRLIKNGVFGIRCWRIK